MLTITVDDSAFRSHMQELQKRLDNLTPVLNDIGNRMENAVRQRFATRIDPSGAPWKPWESSTLESYPSPASQPPRNTAPATPACSTAMATCSAA